MTRYARRMNIDLALRKDEARHEEWNGRQCYVVPAVATKEGVMNGAYKPWEEIEKSAWTLDRAYVTDDHPYMGLVFVPDEIVGICRNTQIDADKHKVMTELWIFENAQTKTLIKAIEQGIKTDVSVGFTCMVDRLDKEQEWKDPETGIVRKYNEIEREIVFDHVAVLDAGKGACSIDYGCGILTTANTFDVHNPPVGMNTAGSAFSNQIATVADKAVAKHTPPTADESYPWEADAAIKRIRKWASSDGSGDPDTIDWSKYRQAFAWYDAENPKLFGSYKLPHHDIVDGKFVVVWRGVAAAGAAIMGARGGVDIPASDLPDVKAHLAAHYKQFDRVPPWESGDTAKEEGTEMEDDKTKNAQAGAPEAAPPSQSSADGTGPASVSDCMKAIQERDARLEALAKEIEALKGRLSDVAENNSADDSTPQPKVVVLGGADPAVSDDADELELTVGRFDHQKGEWIPNKARW